MEFSELFTTAVRQVLPLAWKKGERADVNVVVVVLLLGSHDAQRMQL
jgi:hypothetical protein